MSDYRFEYTDYFIDEDSSVVAEVFFNRKTARMAVNLVGGNVYVYVGVPTNEYLNFENASSRGQFYSYNIKAQYQRAFGTTLAPIKRTRFEPVPVNGVGVIHKPAAPAAAEPTFEVVVELNGTLTIKGTAPTGDAALAKVNETLAETFKGTFKVKELTQKFV